MFCVVDTFVSLCLKVNASKSLGSFLQFVINMMKTIYFKNVDVKNIDSNFLKCTKYDYLYNFIVE